VKTMVLGSAALLLTQAKEVAAAAVPANVVLYPDEPSIGETGYERRVARIFEQAAVRKV